jgi:hypothetical protein
VSLGIKRLLDFGDSKVVIEHVNKEWDCVKDTMDAYCAEIRKLEDHFEELSFSTSHGTITWPPTYFPN